MPLGRYSHNQQLLYFRKTVNFNDANISAGVLVGYLPVNAVITSVAVFVQTAFNAATTNVLQVGTTATGGEIAATAQTIAGTIGFKAPTAWQTIAPPAADLPVFASYTQTGAPATAGLAHVVITYACNNDQ